MARPSDPGSAASQMRVLFRYRDLVAKTLQEHRALLAAKGECWWGWWKRPTESARREIWTRLAEQLGESGGNAIPVGLFDSGADDSQAVYVAWIDQVIPPPEDPDQAGWIPEQLAGEDARRLIPAYYRKSPFSRAWIRLVSIDTAPVKFFGAFSFDEPPPLPHYELPALARLRGKKMLEAKELRGMDTTIWSIRGASPSDSEERLLVTGSGPTAPVSPEPIAARSGLILHLTDLHFATDPFRDQHSWRLESDDVNASATMSDAITDALSGRTIGLVVVTGDLTYRGSDDEFKEARLGLTRLVGNLNLGVEHVVVAPGNHDICWTREPSDEYDPSAKVAVAPPGAEKGYRGFFRDFFRFEANQYLSMARRYVFPHGGIVDIAAANSSSLEQGKNFLAGMGRVQGAALVELRNELGWSVQSQSLALRILALHHHLVATDDVDSLAGYPKGFGLAVDATRTQREAVRSGVQLVLHGHRHQPFVWRSQVYESPESSERRWELGALSIVGGGSGGSSEVVEGRHHFNLLEVGSKAVVLEMFRAKDDEPFRSIKKWRAETTLREGALRLSEWDPVHGDD